MHLVFADHFKVRGRPVRVDRIWRGDIAVQPSIAAAIHLAHAARTGTRVQRQPVSITPFQTVLTVFWRTAYRWSYWRGLRRVAHAAPQMGSPRRRHLVKVQASRTDRLLPAIHHHVTIEPCAISLLPCFP